MRATAEFFSTTRTSWPRPWRSSPDERLIARFATHKENHESFCPRALWKAQRARTDRDAAAHAAGRRGLDRGPCGQRERAGLQDPGWRVQVDPALSPAAGART